MIVTETRHPAVAGVGSGGFRSIIGNQKRKHDKNVELNTANLIR